MALAKVTSFTVRKGKNSFSKLLTTLFLVSSISGKGVTKKVSHNGYERVSKVYHLIKSSNEITHCGFFLSQTNICNILFCAAKSHVLSFLDIAWNHFLDTKRDQASAIYL